MARRVRWGSVVAAPASAPSCCKASGARPCSHLRKEQSRLEARSGIDGCAGQPLGKGEVVARPGCRGPRQHHAGLNRGPAVEAPDGQPQGVLPPTRPGCRQGAGKSPGRRASAKWRELGAEDLPIQRVRQAGNEASPLLLDVHQAAAPQGFQVDDRIDKLEELHLQRLAKRQHAERLADRVLEVAQASLDDLDEAGRRGQRAAKPPDALLAPKHAGLESAEDDLPQEQGVALRPPVEQVHRRSVDWTLQGGGQKLLDLVDGQGMQLESLGHSILPEGNDRTWSRLSGTKRGEHERLRRGRQQMREGS